MPSAARLLAGVAVLTATGLAGGLALSAGPAYADVTTSTYTVGAPSGAVTDVTATPSGLTVGASANFEVDFRVGTALSGSSSDWVSVVPSTALGSTPSNIDLVDGSCIQAGTNGGAYSATGVTIDLTSSCSLSVGSQAQVDFQADAPASTGTFSFAVSTSRNLSPAPSNTVTVGAAGPILAASSYAFGANATYTISEVPVANLSSSGTSLTLTAAATQGAATIAFLNTGAGGAGYSVSVAPSSGSASADTVTDASATGATVTLTLATAVADGDTLSITATGTNPAISGSPEADDIAVQPGNGTVETTNPVLFGGSVTGVNVAPSSPVAGATGTYTVSFRATDAVSASGDIYLTEQAGPTGFATVTGTEVVDTTQGWHFVASGASYSTGSATIPLQDAVNAGDDLTVILAGVTNPASSRTIGDFTVATSGDPVAVSAPAYQIGANGSPGVVVTVNPTTTGAVATYTISNLRASAALAGGSGTIELEAPAGTVFPNNPVYYQLSDSTTASGSGTVSAALSGGGTNVVTFTVPNTINSGDALSLTVEDVVNPGTASGTDSIELVGNVTGPPAVPTTTTTTTVRTTTTTRPPVKKAPRPKLTDLTTKANVTKDVVDLRLRCTAAACTGTVTLTDVTTVVGTSKYKVKAGKTGTVAIRLRAKGTEFLAGAKHHTIKVTAKVTVSGGQTVKQKTTLVA